MMRADVRIAPSILSSDFARLAEEVARVEAAGADLLHVDVMADELGPDALIENRFGHPPAPALACADLGMAIGRG